MAPGAVSDEDDDEFEELGDRFQALTSAETLTEEERARITPLDSAAHPDLASLPSESKRRHAERIDRTLSRRDVNYERKRERVRAAKAAAKELRQAKEASLTHEDKLVFYEMYTARRALESIRVQLRAQMAAPWSDSSVRGVRVAIDLGMEALMNSSELKSLSSQVTMGYGCVITRCLNQPGWQPLRLALVGLDDAPTTRARLPYVDQWGVRVHGADFGAAIPALYAVPPDTGEPATIDGSRVVVLSPDAADVLDEVREDCVYVIGGLCDYKRIANVTCRRAEARGARAARLPISEVFGLGNRIGILTVNQVITALHDVANGCSWADALRRAMPARKLRDVADGVGMSSAAAIPAKGAAEDVPTLKS